MDQPLKNRNTIVQYRDSKLALPLPVILVIEDVGWWQGFNGAAFNQPFRNNLNRRHCLADYEAIAGLAEQLSMRIVIGMVLCEWDRTDFLKTIPTATWMGASWTNKKNQGLWLDHASDFINSHTHLLEPALHGVGHEFWHNGRMQRSEFHDSRGRMRSLDIVEQHLSAYGQLIEQNNLPGFPKIFIPPALNHSLGNLTIQPLLKQYGVDYVITRFSRARQYARPVHPLLTWESDVLILERGESPVDWDVVSADPAWPGAQPVLALHWSNLLHLDPNLNQRVADRWAGLIIDKLQGLELMPAADMSHCCYQAAVHYLARIKPEAQGVAVELEPLQDIPFVSGQVCVKIKGPLECEWRCTGGKVVSIETEPERIRSFFLQPDDGCQTLRLSPERTSA